MNRGGRPVAFLGRAALWHQQSKTRRGWPASLIFGYCSPMPNLPPAPPMTLDNMRENGVRTLAAWCLARDCNHHRVVDVSGYPDDLSVPSFGPEATVRALRAPWRGCKTELAGNCRAEFIRQNGVIVTRWH